MLIGKNMKKELIKLGIKNQSNMPKTVITYAKELIESVGKEEAIKVFEKRIEDFGEPKDFDGICKVSGWEVAIQYIKEEIK